MIIARVREGLGNQLFHYAAARALADKHGHGLMLDLRDYRKDRQRHFQLDEFHIRAETASTPYLLRHGFFASPLLRRRLERFGLLKTVRVRDGEYARAIGSGGAIPKEKHIYLDGFWHSWKYFESDREAILRDLRFKYAPEGLNAALFRRISRGKSVCLHLRRGDYLHPDPNNKYFFLGEAYYHSAIKRLKLGPGPWEFYVFSDDPAWCRTHLHLPGKRIIVDRNSGQPWEDLRLMSACRHFVIGNSTFSWWAAYLGGAADKRVVAPKNWFFRRSGPAHTDDPVCPAAWKRVQ